ncbi:PLP-dependent aminotransferase family protein [Dactylosporangium sp. AC04546]|uniref:MocR-like pyridoxine biosynthesis transcription factor PdxR n=1 Tax=Dactylosporangium sp. AC04546 TaxID=2862460 RepID=UPI001EE04220|nr:PLP-dependent aminotransferase family protein [Dactylosporangium sp. AC04546]WVK86639.1 PLP-dependent aminotransferase family protein [Dactylosporangium sp. AC04546]
MTVEWTGLSPDVLVPIDRGSGEPLRTQIERGLREAIRAGRLRAGERLPSTRELARQLGVSRGIVVDCFDQLQAEGYLSSRTGAATRVSPTSQPPGQPPSRPDRPDPPPAAPLVVDFAPAVPDLASFPRADWARSAAEACRDTPTAALGYDDPRGTDALRTVLASYLGRVRGAAAGAGADGIVVTTGFAQGLNLALAALAARGVDRVAFEDPGYDGTSQLACAHAGVRLVPVPVDEHGLRVDALAATGARAVVVSPAHQWPTGVVLAPARRLALAHWAATTGGWIVEDDYDAEFRYDREPVGAVQGLAPHRVVYIGTASKALAPTLRLGWMLCPAELAGPVAELKLRTDRGCPGLEQRALARMIESGRFDRHLRRMRKVYAGRRDALVAALAEHAPAVGITGLAAGFHAVANLPAGADEAAVVAGARERGVGLYGMAAHRAAPGPAQLILGFGQLSERAIAQGIVAVADLLGGSPADRG